MSFLTTVWQDPQVQTAVNSVVATIIVGGVGLLGALATGLKAKVDEYLKAHNLSAVAATVDSAAKQLDAAATMEANAIAGKIQAGEFNYLDRKAWEQLAQQGAATALGRIGPSVAAAAPLANALVPLIMTKVDALVSLNPSIPVPSQATTTMNAPQPLVTTTLDISKG